MNAFKGVMLITIDSLRADSVYGVDPYTPNFEELCDNGFKFVNAYSNSPGTPSSFQSILSSTYPMMYGGYDRMNVARPYMPSYLSSFGVSTFGVTTNIYLSKYFGYDKGFDIYIDDYHFRNLSLIERIKFTPYGDWTKINKIINKVLEKAIKNSKFFIWIHYMDVHVPYKYKSKIKNLISLRRLKRMNKLVIDVSRGIKCNVSEEIVNDLIELYKEGVKRVDEALGDLIKSLRRLNVYDDVLLIVTSDHGEEFMEHGGLCHMPKLYEELVRVPLIISNPSLERRVVRSLVDHLDISPTVAEALDVKRNRRWLGRSLLGDIKDKVIVCEVANSEMSSKVERDLWKIAVRFKKWKLHYEVSTGVTRLYDLSLDPRERLDLSYKREGLVMVIKKIIRDHIKRVQVTSAIAKLAVRSKAPQPF